MQNSFVLGAGVDFQKCVAFANFYQAAAQIVF